jgi:hypothetical protein
MVRRAAWIGVVLSACTPGNLANFTAKGEFGGKPIDMGFTLSSGGSAVEDRRARIGGTRQLVVIRADTCPTEPCPDVATLVVGAPPSPLYAGRWTISEGELQLQRGGDVLARGELGGAWALDFMEPVYSSGGPLVLHKEANFTRSPTPDPKLELQGTVDLEYQCRGAEGLCGAPISGSTNPRGVAYAEDTCPRALVEPFEAAPTWKGTTLLLGDREIDCRETGAGVLCHQRRAAVELDGCRWNVHFFADGALDVFAVSAWAERGCPVRSCNTYR